MKKKDENAIDFDELRRLLVGREQIEILKLKKRLDDPELHASDVSRVLPEAMMLRSSRDKKIAKALEPTIEETLRRSIRKDPKSIGDALFPVMGPAIRKAISSAILGMIQSFNQALEHSLSIQGLKWRLEALKTGKPFAEVVLLHTLVYQVEQVFLTHRNTGLVLQHVVSKEATAQDPDLVSGMLTAIQDFVSDSFGADRGGGSLDTLRVGERSIWIEQGPRAVLAAVIRGNPPETLKLVLRETLRAIHLTHREALDSFEGDTTPFEATRGHLEDCLQSESERQKRRRTSPWLWIILGAVIVSIASWSFHALRGHWRWSRYLEKLDAEPGIVVTAVEKRSGKYHILGLRDPLAADPVDLLRAEKLEPDRAVFYWEPYHALNPEFLLERIRQVITPPETMTLELEDGILRAQGSAPREWILEARRLLKSIPDITAFEVNADQRDMKTVMESIEKQSPLFGTGDAQIAPGQEETIGALVADIKRLHDLAQLSGKRAHVEIVGHADSTGSEETNLALSRERAMSVLSMLTSKGLRRDSLSAIGIGSKEPLRKEITELDRKFNRCVTFRVTLTDLHP